MCFMLIDLTGWENNMKSHKWLSVVIVILVMVVSAIGFFSDGMVIESSVVNPYGDEMVLFGKGIYAFETMFKAPILIGTDFMYLFVISPIFIYFQWFKKTESLAKDIIILGLLTCFMYYSSSLAFGAAFNAIFALYILLFSLVFFRMVELMLLFDYKKVEEIIIKKQPPKGVRIFLILAGSSVLIWLVEIINSIFSKRPPMFIGMSTTEPTFVKDLGLILPLCWLSSYWITKKRARGVVVGSMMLILCASVGLIVISQSVFQYQYGVVVELEEMMKFVFPFILLSFFSLIFFNQLLRWGVKE